jgi:hypothetical protein
MLLDTLNKILIVLFFLSCLNTIRHGYYFIQTWFTSTDETPIKYRLTNTSLFLLGVSIAYILTTIFTGIKI